MMVDLELLPEVEGEACTCRPGHCAADIDAWVIIYEWASALVMRPTHRWRPVCRLKQAVEQGWSA